MSLSEKDIETKKWFQISKADLKAGELLFAEKGFLSQAAFHAQQSAEKSLKGLLVWHQVRFSKQHDLQYLADLVLQKEPLLKSVLNDIEQLNPYAVTFRYPGEEEEDLSSEDVGSALKLAKLLLLSVLTRVPTEMHPTN